jgi:hypothetical protein
VYGNKHDWNAFLVESFGIYGKDASFCPADFKNAGWPLEPVPLEIHMKQLMVHVDNVNRLRTDLQQSTTADCADQINEPKTNGRPGAKNRLTMAIERAMHDLRKEFKRGRLKKQPSGNDIFNRLRNDDPTEAIILDECGKDPNGEPTLTWEDWRGILHTVKKKTIMTKISEIRKISAQ